ncbi:MAG TPA: MBL fold metallo-hydrolase [Acidimicrobiales bacterium]|nr:MBL fold metallo-hydrolase [Acidimicrobiales bacterium]
MSEATQQWRVGRARITSVVESQTDGIPPGFMLPGLDEQTVLRHRWLAPHYVDERGTVGLRVQAFVIEIGDRLVVVDPCVGNGKVREVPRFSEQTWPFMERFRAAGFDPLEVDTVVHTHLHVDHVGWDTHRDGGRWVPTFARARHLFVQAELDDLASDGGADVARIRADTIGPILDAGLADVVEPDADLGDGLRLAPTHGHTVGHVSLWLDSDGRSLLVTGDTIHHPVQCAEPELGFIADRDADAARATRRRVLGTAADAGALVLGTHFPTAPGGRVMVDGEAWRFSPLAAEE